MRYAENEKDRKGIIAISQAIHCCKSAAESKLKTLREKIVNAYNVVLKEEQNKG